MAEMKVSVGPRSDFGSAAAKRIRRSGMVPAVIYGGTMPNVAVALDPRIIHRVLRSEAGRNTILSIDVDGGAADNVILKDWQVDPVRDTFLHADFQRIAMDQLLTVTIPIAIRGEAVGVKTQGGLLEVVLREIEVECLPADIPERIECDVSALEINDSIRVRDLPVMKGVEISEEPDRVVVHVVTIREEKEEAVPVAGEEAVAEAEAVEGEPEVISKGKKGEEEAE